MAAGMADAKTELRRVHVHGDVLSVGCRQQRGAGDEQGKGSDRSHEAFSWMLDMSMSG
jgi:hypothetical protein